MGKTFHALMHTSEQSIDAIRWILFKNFGKENDYDGDGDSDDHWRRNHRLKALKLMNFDVEEFCFSIVFAFL